MLKSILLWANVLFIILVSFLLLSDLTLLKIINLSNIIIVITAFGGALSGAWGAYKLQIYKEKEKREKEKISALNKALFILLRQINAMEIFKRDLAVHIAEDKIVRAFNLPSWKTNSYNDLKFNFEELSFILDTEDLNLLHELFILQECFEQAIETINQRTIFITNKIAPEFELKEIDITSLTAEKFKKIINANNVNNLVFLTNNMYEHIYKTREELEDIEKKFFNFAKSQYPNQKFIRFESE